MLNKKIATLSASLLVLQATCQPLVFAQTKDNMGLPEIPGVVDSVPGVSNGAKPGGSSPSVNDAWPWMQNDPGAAKKESAAASSSTPARVEKPAVEPSAKPEPAVGSTKLELEKPQSAVEARPEHTGNVEKRTEDKRSEEKRTEQPIQAKAKSTMLYGRIEELTSGAGAKFPIILKAQTAKMDPRGVAMKGGAAETLYSGSLVKSFPNNYAGTWGGKLQVYANQEDRLYYDVDPEEAKQTAELLKPGLLGQCNLQFEQRGSMINLEPAQIFFSVPMSESRLSGMMNSMGQGQTVNIPGFGSMPGGGGMGAMMKSMMSSMPYIFSVNLGESAGTGVTGNQQQSSVLKNDIHQLSPTVVEQQIVTTESTTNAKTGRTRRGYSETVVRVTRYDSMRLYVQTASVDYSADKRFLRKLVFNGYVTKGVVEQVNPMGSMQIPGMQSGGANPFQGLQGMPGAGGNGANPFQGLQGLFGQ
jgi:hypothetical protein